MNTNEEKELLDITPLKQIDVAQIIREAENLDEAVKLMNGLADNGWLKLFGRAALRVESEPVLWQFYDDGKWFNCMSEQHRENTEAAGYEMRPLYTAPQTEPKDTGSGL